MNSRMLERWLPSWQSILESTESIATISMRNKSELICWMWNAGSESSELLTEAEFDLTLAVREQHLKLTERKDVCSRSTNHTPSVQEELHLRWQERKLTQRAEVIDSGTGREYNWLCSISAYHIAISFMRLVLLCRSTHHTSLSNIVA